MRLGGRLAAAIEVLDDIGRRHRPATDALKDWGLSHRFAGAGDRAAIGNIVYDALRRKRSAGWLLDGDTPRAIGFGALLLEWGETAKSLNEALEGDRFAPEPLSEAEQQGIEERRKMAPPETVAADCPDWAAPLLQQVFGDNWVTEAGALAGRPPLDLRVNTLKASRDKVLAELKDTGAKATAIAPLGIRIAPIEGAGRHPNVQAEPSFQKGWFEVQDEGSQIVAELAQAKPGMQVLDFCAGAGGKTLALAAMMDNHGQLFATDDDKRRLAPIHERLERSGARNVQVRTPRGAKDALAGLEGRADLVLIDAPCTGTGAWRRNPDAKWRVRPGALDERLKDQIEALDRAVPLVKTGGRIAYVTCSVLDEENGVQVRAFLARHAGFAIEPPADVTNALGERAFLFRRAVLTSEEGLLMTPRRTDTDGFFVSVLRRIG